MEERTSSKVVPIVITILVIVVLGLTGFIVYDKVLRKDEVDVKYNNIDELEKTTESDQNITIGYLTKEDIKKINTFNIEHGLMEAGYKGEFDGTYKYILSFLTGDNLLLNDKFKISFAYQFGRTLNRILYMQHSIEIVTAMSLLRTLLSSYHQSDQRKYSIAMRYYNIICRTVKTWN